MSSSDAQKDGRKSGLSTINYHNLHPVVSIYKALMHIHRISRETKMHLPVGNPSWSGSRGLDKRMYSSAIWWKLLMLLKNMCKYVLFCEGGVAKM